MQSQQPTQPVKLQFPLFLATVLTNKSVILTITVYILCGYTCIIALFMCVANVIKGQQYSCLVLTGMEKDNSIHLLLQLVMKDIIFLEL